MPKNILQKQS